VTCWVSLNLGNLTLRSKIISKCLAHDGTLERCVPLVPKVHTLFVMCLNLLKFSLYFVLYDIFQYSDLEALGCLPYPVV
jgi:hypothetical protein